MLYNFLWQFKSSTWLSQNRTAFLCLWMLRCSHLWTIFCTFKEQHGKHIKHPCENDFLTNNELTKAYTISVNGCLSVFMSLTSSQSLLFLLHISTLFKKIFFFCEKICNLFMYCQDSTKNTGSKKIISRFVDHLAMTTSTRMSRSSSPLPHWSQTNLVVLDSRKSPW